MSYSEEAVYAKFERKLQLGEDFVDLKGDFLYCWPYAWDEDVNWDVINKLARSLVTWVQSIPPSREIALKVAQTNVLFAFYTSPTSWRQNAPDDPHDFQKILLHAKILLVYFLVDDIAEDQFDTPNHAKFAQSAARLITKILGYEMCSVEEIKLDPMYHTILQTSPDVAHGMELIFAAGQELKEHFGVTRKSSKHLARMVRYQIELLTWQGSNHLSHLLNPGLRYHLRVYTGGICTNLELVFLLDGIRVPRIIRDHAYWARCYQVVGYLPCIVNDIMGIEKEWKQHQQDGKRVDNAVFLDIEITGCSFERAVARAVGEHNTLLQELHDNLRFLTNNDEYLHEFNSEERNTFYRSIFLMGEYVAHHIQAQVLMPRYNSGIQFTFEKSLIIPTKGSQNGSAEA